MAVIIKTKEQIEAIKKASLLTAQTLDMIWKYVKAWVRTEELDNICNDFILKNGGKSACIWYHGFPKYTCISLNSTVCHWIPNKNEILKEGDILNIDVTTIVDWYFWDASRMYTVWEISKEARKLIQVTHDAWRIWIREIYPWNFTWNIWYEIAKFVEPKWYSVVTEYAGHWVWVRFHEDPFINHKAPKNSWIKMKPWMIITVEPMINIWKYKTKLLPDKWTVKTIDNSLSAQWEHTILVTDFWYEILTKTDREFDFLF